VLCNADRYSVDDAVALSADSLSMMQAFLSETPETLLTLTPPRRIAAEIDRALRWFVRVRVERNLKSADFLDQLRAGQ